MPSKAASFLDISPCLSPYMIKSQAVLKLRSLHRAHFKLWGCFFFKETFLCNKLLLQTALIAGTDLDWEKKPEQSDLIN